jgi:hypothetical protein
MMIMLPERESSVRPVCSAKAAEFTPLWAHRKVVSAALACVGGLIRA